MTFRIEQSLQILALESSSNLRVARSIYYLNTERTRSLRFGFCRGVSMADAMETFIVDQNIKRYELLLQEETHPDKRRILFQLLAEEAGRHPDPVKRATTLRKLRISIT